MLSSIFVIICLILPQYVYSGCCRLPFTDDECQVNRKGPHRYEIFPDRHSGLVKESTECHINDYDANYRKVVKTKNVCNDCPGLLILHTNSSEIFLFPEYLERILEGRTLIQRKNVVILTTGLVGAYDIDFTFLSRYYSTSLVDNVPSIYVDLQLPAFNPKHQTQTNLRLRLPEYDEDKDGSSKINRDDLIHSPDNNEQIIASVHQLPYLYHFDIEKHRHSPDRCTLYDVQVSARSLIWNVFSSDIATCHTFMSSFGRNKCLATGFTRLFCSIEENIFTDDRLKLSPYLKTTNRVEHLTVAVFGSRHVDMSLSNEQMRPSKQIKILLLQGHLTVTDINLNLPIRVEYGWNCEDFSLTIPAGLTATRYRRFDGENLTVYEGNSVITLPNCFRVIQGVLSTIKNTLPPRLVELETDKDPEIIIDSKLINTTRENKQSVVSNHSNILRNKNTLAYIAIAIFVLAALIRLCHGIVYYNRHRQSDSTVKHSSHTNQELEHMLITQNQMK